MHVIGTVGLPGSGKGEVATVAREEGIPVVTMGDVIRQETEARGLDPASDHGTVAQALREEEGPTAIAERSLPMIDDRLENHDTVLVDGLRSGVEAQRFDERFGGDFTLISIEAPAEVRAERIETRGRDKSAADGGESLAERDERELGFGMGDAMDRADVVVENTASLDAFHQRVRTLLRGGVESQTDTTTVDDNASVTDTSNP